MIEITVKVIPNGNRKLKETIGVMTIINDGTGTVLDGNYRYNIRKDDNVIIDDTNKIIKYKTNICEGVIKSFPREKRIWSLIQTIFKSIPEYKLERK